MRFVFAALIYCLATASAQACKCPQTTPEARFDEAPIVFVARITQVEDVAQEALWHLAQRHRHDEEWDPRQGVDYGLRMHFEVEMVIKGDPGRLTALITGYGGGDCGIAILPGGTLLVATDSKGYLQRCGLSAEFELRDCLGVLELEKLRARALVGKSALDVPDEADVEDDGLDLFKAFVRSGRNPYSLTSAECPVRLKSAQVPDEANPAKADAE